MLDREGSIESIIIHVWLGDHTYVIDFFYYTIQGNQQPENFFKKWTEKWQAGNKRETKRIKKISETQHTDLLRTKKNFRRKVERISPSSRNGWTDLAENLIDSQS